jgi:hypothetical protein
MFDKLVPGQPEDYPSLFEKDLRKLLARLEVGVTPVSA